LLLVELARLLEVRLLGVQAPLILVVLLRLALLLGGEPLLLGDHLFGRLDVGGIARDASASRRDSQHQQTQRDTFHAVNATEFAAGRPSRRNSVDTPVSADIAFWHPDRIA